jgi:hypothetical protein
MVMTFVVSAAHDHQVLRKGHWRSGRELDALDGVDSPLMLALD